ncbi:MAG: glycosyltransferase family 4 protein [Candidatus Thorarchaeota archaeon]
MKHITSLLMVSPRYLPAIGGVEKHVHTLAKRLLKRGITVTILTVSHSSELKTMEFIEGIKILRMPYSYSRVPVLGWLWVLKHIRKFENHDVIHFHDTIPLLFWGVPLLLLYAFRRVAVTFHGYEKDPVPLRFLLLRKIASKLISNTLCIGSFIESIYGIKCRKKTVGAVTQNKIEPRNSSNIAIYLGRLEEDTGILEYIEAIRILREKHGFKLPIRVIGGGSLRDTIERKSREYGITIELLGVVGKPDPFLADSKFCFASGYLSILEALSNNVPVIGLAKTPLRHKYLLSMKTAGAPISIQQSAEFVADEMAHLLTNRKLYSKIQVAGRKFTIKMSWEELERMYIKMWTR